MPETATAAVAPRPAKILRRARRLHDLAASVASHEHRLEAAIKASYVDLRAEVVDRELAGIPVARLREVSEDRLRTTPLEEAGLTTVLAVHRSTEAALDRLPGMGPKSARLAVAAAAQVAAAVAETARVRIRYDPSDRVATALLRPLHRIVGTDRLMPSARQQAQQVGGELAGIIAAARPARNRLTLWLHPRKRRGDALAALESLRRLLIWAEAREVEPALEAAERVLRRRPAGRRAVWKDFEQHSPEYYVALGEIVEAGVDVHASEGFLSEDVLERVRAQSLDDRYRRVSLRGYQSFGARFALAQRRVIIGDEMGLGKTIQAIAVLCHLRAGDDRYFLVVCPASVLINWQREIESRSHLRVHRLHGTDRDVALKAWLKEGDVAITTFDSLHDLAVPASVKLGALVVDEAHYVKNPSARRSRAVRRWTDRAERVLFLTGTPMENRVSEFKSLVHYLQPSVVPEVSGTDAVAGAVAFRTGVAPVYLRRNQEDVLTELPELVSTDEWLEFSRSDFDIYRGAVASGNFMAMRRAAYSDPTGSAKLARLLELVEEATDNGHKVVVFSYFRDVLDTVAAAVGARAFGPLTGSVPPMRRQALVDEFAAADGAAVLVAQIQAGGVGLNIQAASVVVICEPQVKPTIEDQAIARCHRMGQVRTVQVHRLLTSDSVDERMLEILATKAQLFDDYARQSHLASTSPDALDVADASMGRQVVALEKERLAL
ncbi:MAG TPA: DEAD/DEAH box helicase [Micromonosporaceae bacterium]